MPARLLDLIAERLRTYRAQQNLTQEQAAHLLGCSIPTYRALEKVGADRRRPDPKLSTVMRVLTFIGEDEAILLALAEHVDASEHSDGSDGCVESH